MGLKVFTTPSVPLTGTETFLTVKEGSTSHLGLLPSGKKRETALQFSEPLRSKIGGVSKPCAMVLRDGTAWGKVGDRLGIALQ